ncbi:MAG: DUF418 domain-containing protein [Brevundimonas sp.]|uniref:DUF418 domain-containing protein n=1 Tax=Brevundimonas sp. TaxID=1871086 RepID=UPI0025B8A033|nr:DUF418 domain-containing protein [Brevundimonas sp.]MBX3476911.1 DUF418 domain-containing protein [Brevundimonas sp.]
MTAAAPLPSGQRLITVDAVRGLALFGVLLVNLLWHADIVIPGRVLARLPTSEIDVWLDPVLRWLWEGKAQALFSLLFGFGFALMFARLEAAGAPAGRIYLRRLLVLLALGFAHLSFVWYGDILHNYALAGLALILFRRVPTPWLIGLGLVLALFSAAAGDLWLALQPGLEARVDEASRLGRAARWATWQGNDYGLYVAQMIQANWREYLTAPEFPALTATALGRFLLGAAIFRLGWLSDPDRARGLARRALAWLAPTGLVLAGLQPLVDATGWAAGDGLLLALGVVNHAAELVLGLAWAAAVVWLARGGVLQGLAAVGRMALTNYLMQSLVFLFVLYGFGLNWLRYDGATFALALALVIFAAQVGFSRWWLARFRFGPAEWVWRALTYGRAPPMRLSCV